MNLTAVTERSAVMERHIVDSLALLPVMEATYAEYNQNKKDLVNNVKIADIGSGAGLPGIIVAIARPCKNDMHGSFYSFIG
jgi:16S rRNA (guanine527-N7)-methyltransferase